jgi:ribosomal protein S18 acetylase RimI-like enzyme
MSTNPAATPSQHANITVRRLSPSDSIGELTRLLHRAYAKQMAMGLSPLAGRQDDKTTRQRVFSGECFVAVDHSSLPDEFDSSGKGLAVETRQRIVGCILFHEIEESKGPPWFELPQVASFSQFAVDPDYQGAGIGQMLLDLCEERARGDKATELACSMAEPDQDLLRYYFRRGYRFIEHWQWPYTNYRSAILSKAL